MSNPGSGPDAGMTENIPLSSELLRDALQPLVGLQVKRLSHAANMRVLHLNDPSDDRPDHGWSLHIQCTWRLERSSTIVTGSYDWFEHETRTDLLCDEWEPTDSTSLQAAILRRLIEYSPGGPREPMVNRTGLLLVERVHADSFGGFVLQFNHDYRLAAFPSTTRGEMWRIFALEADSRHFVVEAGEAYWVGGSPQ